DVTMVTIYRDGSVWCYALRVDGEYDSCHTSDADTRDELAAEIAARFSRATIERVGDVDTARWITP
ncbi:MAG: hypothetical protein IT459_23920, partial [Planctomycetes bacterium]|nr:hypothetical protein [Planctomycetota bacterium]